MNWWSLACQDILNKTVFNEALEDNLHTSWKMRSIPNLQCVSFCPTYHFFESRNHQISCNLLTFNSKTTQLVDDFTIHHFPLSRNFSIHSSNIEIPFQSGEKLWKEIKHFNILIRFYPPHLSPFERIIKCTQFNYLLR